MRLIPILLLLCSCAFAKTEVVYSTDRLGEGAVIQESGTQLVFILFSHWDGGDDDSGTFWVIGIARNFDGETGSGGVYYDTQYPEFPLSRQDTPERYSISSQRQVGTFVVEKDGSAPDDEWWIVMESDGTLDNKTMFNSVFHFATPLRD